MPCVFSFLMHLPIQGHGSILVPQVTRHNPPWLGRWGLETQPATKSKDINKLQSSKQLLDVKPKSTPVLFAPEQ